MMKGNEDWGRQAEKKMQKYHKCSRPGVGNVGPVEFSSNPNQTHLNKLIKVFRITRLQASEFFFRVVAKPMSIEDQEEKL